MLNALGTVFAFTAAAFSVFVTPQGIKSYVVYSGETEAIVAVVPEVFSSYSEKHARLLRLAEEFSVKLGKPVILTEDSVAFATIRRIEKKGRASDVAYLKKRIEKIRADCFAS